MFEFRGDFTTALVVVLQFLLQVYNGGFLNCHPSNVRGSFKALLEQIELSDDRSASSVTIKNRSCNLNRAKLEEIARLFTPQKMAVGSDEDDGSDANNSSGDEVKLNRKDSWPFINMKSRQCMCHRIPWLRKAHRALELLEDYHSRLSEPQDRALRIAIERVIRIFKSRLFQALLESIHFRMMFGSLNNYLNCVQRAWSGQDGHTVASFVSLSDKHIMNRNLYLEKPESAVERILDQPIDEIVSAHLKVLYYLGCEPREYMEAYKNQTQCTQSVVKMLQLLKEENWCLPIMYSVCLDLRILAQKCEEEGKSSKPGEILEKAAECLMGCFRVCAADNRSSDEDTKRLGMLTLVNQLFKVYFRINKLHLCKPLIRAIDSSAFKDYFPLSEQITYKYFVGRKAMFDSDYKSADEFLSFAFQNCSRRFPKNKRSILIYLVPVKMLLGFMPKKSVLERYDVLQFYELACALKEGNVRRFDDVIEKHEAFFIKCGIYLLVEKLKFIAYRNLFKTVYSIKNTHQLDLSNFQSALEFVGERDITMDETHCIVANLIYEGRIKGYISHVHNKLVVSKQNPFPPLNIVT